ncbi:MAG: diguanylate cyclase [Desulfovibrionaceae bacterium]|nr:diguanylate cyclase [Desulfovibrionaceae bacterium]
MHESYLTRLIDDLYDGVYCVNRDGVITSWNESAERITGYRARDVLGRRCSDNILRHIDDAGTELCEKGCPLRATMEDGVVREIAPVLHHADGHRVPVHVRSAPVRDELGRIVGAMEIFSEARPSMRSGEETEALRQQALLDPLTELGNRHHAELALSALYSALAQEGVPFGLLYVDIDGFGRLNDLFGEEAAERMLLVAARNMEGSLRAMDTAFRWGGQEFLATLPNVTPETLRQTAQRVRIFMEHSWLDAENVRLRATVSAGCTMARPDDTVSGCVARARARMEAAKKAGGNRVAGSAPCAPESRMAAGPT